MNLFRLYLTEILYCAISTMKRKYSVVHAFIRDAFKYATFVLFTSHDINLIDDSQYGYVCGKTLISSATAID